MNINRSCRKCGSYIPFAITIDGRKHNLQTRKFCLKCSPFNGHNTKPDDPSRLSKPRDSGRYSLLSDKQRRQYMLRTYSRGLERKKRLIDIAGGKCTKCGYNKTIDALVFHHRNEFDKKFGLTIDVLWGKSMDVIMKEFEKCDVLCSNCHIELHREKRDKNLTTYRNLIKNAKSS